MKIQLIKDKKIIIEILETFGLDFKDFINKDLTLNIDVLIASHEKSKKTIFWPTILFEDNVGYIFILNKENKEIKPIDVDFANIDYQIKIWNEIRNFLFTNH